MSNEDRSMTLKRKAYDILLTCKTRSNGRTAIMLTGAMVDRLAHKAHILDISRDTSHSFEETISWLKAKK